MHAHARTLEMIHIISRASKRHLEAECAVSKFERRQFWYTACAVQVLLEKRCSVVEYIRLVDRLLCPERIRFLCMTATSFRGRPPLFIFFHIPPS